MPQGVTGFGSAILNLCVWVVVVALGVEAVSLNSAVLAECVASELNAIPLLVGNVELGLCAHEE